MIKKLRGNPRLREIFLYCLVGGLTTAVSIATYYLSTRALAALTNLPAADTLWISQAGNAISWVCAVSFAFYPNKKYVFRSVGGDVKREIVEFVTARLLSLGLEAILMALLVGVLHVHDMASKVVTQVVVIAANYFASRFWIFRRR